MKPLYPLKFLKTMRGGTAFKIMLSDRRPYIVKFKLRGEREKEAVNEYVAGKLAQLLSLPVTPLQRLYIPGEFIAKHPQLHKNRAGNAFANLFMENCLPPKDMEILPLLDRDQLINKSSFAAIMVFDQWIMNGDRNRFNILLQRLEGKKYAVYMIDHGYCFPGNYLWNESTLKEPPKYKPRMRVYNWFANYIANEQELHSFTQKIMALKNSAILKIIESIPEDWEVPQAERQALFQFLLEHKRALPKVVEQLIHIHSDKFYE